MRIKFVGLGSGLALLLFAGTLVAFAQSPKRVGFPPESRLTSTLGYSGQENVIAHRVVSKSTHAQCIQVEHHPKTENDGAACVLRLPGGERLVIKFNETAEIPTGGEIFLECQGDKPAKCTVGLY